MSGEVPELGRVEQVDLRSVWTHEARSLTPWLLDNADVLADVLGIDLELSANEHAVGTFSLDLIGRDLTNDCVLIVENQLEVSDHDHLGKLITYAAGTEARTVVWLAPRFRDEHRQALELLNDLGEGRVRFFAIELGAVRIGDSAVAPLLETRVEPSDWHARLSAVARSATEATGKPALYQQSWGRFLDRVHSEHPGWTRARSAPTGNWLNLPCPLKGDAHYALSFAQGGRLRAELYVDAPDPAQVEHVFAALESHQEQLEATFGAPLSWEPLPERRASRVAAYGEGDVADLDDHDAYIDWFFDTLGRLRVAVEQVAREIGPL